MKDTSSAPGKSWRETFPGKPYWVHIQTTDVHWPWNPPPPFAGLFIRPKQRETFYEWERKLGLGWPSLDADFKKANINRVAFFDAIIQTAPFL